MGKLTRTVCESSSHKSLPFKFNSKYKQPFIAMKSTKKLTIPIDTRFKTQKRSGRKDKINPILHETETSNFDL